jgi:hypothetical protein
MKNLLPSPLPLAARCLRDAVIILGLCCAVAPALAQGVNFNDGNDNGWTRMDPIQQALEANFGAPQPAFVTWSFPDGGYRLQSDPSPDATLLGPSRGGSYWTNAIYTYTNFYASVDVRPWGTNVNQAVGLLGRMQAYSGSGATFAYTLTYEPGVQDFQLTSFNGGDFVVLTVQKADLSPTNSHRIVFTGIDQALEGRIYVLPDVTNPVATITATDSTYSIGWCGILVFSINNAATDATYDNYLALPEPPASLSISRSGTDVSVSWPIGLVSYTLQSNSVLPAANWSSITNGITQSSGQHIYKTAPTSSAFYRLLMN